MKNLLGGIVFSLLACGIAPAQTVVTGTLLGHDGKPMIKARIVLTTVNRDTSVKRIWADKDGKYSITVDSSRIWGIWYTGVSHSSHLVPIYVDKPQRINIDVRLSTYEYLDSINSPRLIGDFNHLNVRTGIAMQKEPDGTFSAEVETKADTFRYEIAGITKDGHSTNGTESERYVYDGAGDYMSVVTPVNGNACVTFDPAKLVRSTEPLKITYSDPHSREAQFANIYDEIERNANDFMTQYNEYKNSGKDTKDFNYDWTKVIESITTRLKQESNPVLRQELYFEYITLGLYRGRLDSSFVIEGLKEIPASSLLWSLQPYLIVPALQYFAGLPAKERDEYVDKVLSENPDVNVKTALLFDLFIRSRMDKTGKAAGYYNTLVNQYGDTRIGEMVKSRYSAAAKVAVGNPAPAFSVASLADSAKIYTNGTFQGKYYMIDFWATWCGPCVREMEYLHKAYAKFKDKNFDMLSISLDVSPQDALKFQKGKWPMPWLNAFAGTKDSKIVKDYEVIGIPRPILVDPSGKIVAMEEQLRGDELEKTLEKYLGN